MPFFAILQGGPGTLLSWPVTSAENPSRKTAKGEPPDLKNKVDVSKVDGRASQSTKLARDNHCHPGRHLSCTE